MGGLVVTETTLPAWLVRELEAYVAERRKGDITVRFDGGKIPGILVGPEFRPPPALEADTHASCPDCASPAEAIDNGRRLYCARCRRTHVLAR